MKNYSTEEYFEAEYASEILTNLPAGYIDKSICACGITTVALENDIPTIIAVPTRELALNKCMSYPNVRSDKRILAVMGEVSRTDIDNFEFTDGIIKIMVTYDSIDKVKHLLPACHLVIDESNQLLSLATLKPEVIDNLFQLAYHYKDTVTFVSATPIPVEYMPEWISSIPQIKYHWKNTVKSTPILCERTYPIRSLQNEFLKPLKEKKTLTVAGKSFSKVIVFVNSVLQIVNIVKEVGINKNDCGIICGENITNDLKIKGIPRYRTGEMPVFLFVTSSGFQGIDLYDKNAMTIVVSSTTKNWHMIDMLTDLKQAVSRQRDKSNPNYGSYIYIYNTSIHTVSEDELMKKIDQIRRKMEVNIPHFNNLIASGDYNSVITDRDVKSYAVLRNGKYVLNENAFNADEYFILNVRNQFNKGFDMSANIPDSMIHNPVELPKVVSYQTLVKNFKQQKGQVDWTIYSTNPEWIDVIEKSYKYYKKVWENYTHARRMVENYGEIPVLVKNEIMITFRIGNKYSKGDIERKLQVLYNRFGVERKAKWFDIGDFYDYRMVKINGTRLIQLLQKQNYLK